MHILPQKCFVIVLRKFYEMDQRSGFCVSTQKKKTKKKKNKKKKTGKSNLVKLLNLIFAGY